MSGTVEGTFEVNLTPQKAEADQAEPKLGRMTIDKSFAGGLVGTSRGQMLSALTEVQGSAGYVAIERVRGTLDGREGTFVLQHSGTMARGGQAARISVVPDSGTEELAGLSGQMSIRIDGGKHYYRFEYSFAE